MEHGGATAGTFWRPTNSEIVVCADPAEVARSAACRFVRAVSRFVRREGTCAVALAGGRTPIGLYRMLASEEFLPRIDWKKVHVFWSDERAVPQDHPDSNYGMTLREMIDHIPIRAAHVHRMEAEQPDLEAAADRYADVIRRHLPLDPEGFPRFHLILLGIGVDGHTASLFPGSPSLDETARWVTTAASPTSENRRLTLTLPVLNAARSVMFLVTGRDKAETLYKVMLGNGRPPLPSQRVAVPHGRRTFIVDAAAAVRLTGKVH